MDIKLFTQEEEQYGPKYKDHLFEQYKLYVSSMEKNSDRRLNANKNFIAINTILVTLLGITFQYNLFSKFNLVRGMLSLLGIVFCVIFWHLIRSYKQLNTGKFKVIHEIEKKLPLDIYKFEWEILKKGQDPQTYYPFSHIELLLPWIFGVIYVVLAISFYLILK